VGGGTRRRRRLALLAAEHPGAAEAAARARRRAPLLRNTLARLAPLTPAARTLVLTNAGLRDAVLALAPELPPENVIAEPAPAGTCAALAWAAREVARRAGRDAVLVCVHADWAVADEDGFRRALARAARAAREHASLVTVGVVPTRDDPGFGYIQPADEVEPGVSRVARFVEKPSRERAARMREDGFLWNSGSSPGAPATSSTRSTRSPPRWARRCARPATTSRRSSPT
jgi:mannose-1-phosphate guanylyltransferase